MKDRLPCPWYTVTRRRVEGELIGVAPSEPGRVRPDMQGPALLGRSCLPSGRLYTDIVCSSLESIPAEFCEVPVAELCRMLGLVE
jgi:hypothetical protein